MTAVAFPHVSRCLDSHGRPKAAYASEAAAHRALASSPKWRRRADWPVSYRCPDCGWVHLAHAQWVGR